MQMETLYLERENKKHQHTIKARRRPGFYCLYTDWFYLFGVLLSTSLTGMPFISKYLFLMITPIMLP